MNDHDRHHDHSACQTGVISHPATDPVCGMTVTTGPDTPSVEHGGSEYHFCSASCRAKFVADPQRYLANPAGDKTPGACCGGHGAAKPAPTGGKYDIVPGGHAGPVFTCPMHPEVRQPGPGACPICGMALELESGVPGDEGPNPELADFTRRFWVGAALSLPVLVLAMGPMFGLGVREPIGHRTAALARTAACDPGRSVERMALP